MQLDSKARNQALSESIKAMKNERRFDEGRDLILQTLPPEGLDANSALLKAELLHEMRCYDESIAEYDRLIAENQKNTPKVRFSYAKRLFTRGFGFKAHKVLKPAIDSANPDPRIGQFFDKLDAFVRTVDRLEGGALDEETDHRVLALKHAILKFSARNLSGNSSKGFGKVALITGSLGPGGAERQMSRLAAHLALIHREGGASGGVAIDQPVELLPKSISEKSSNNFFLQDVLDAGVPVTEIDAMPVAGSLEELNLGDEELAILMAHLPSTVTYGILRLVPYFRTKGFDAVSIWQDGACLFAALAALVAGVPRIQLGIRGLPPNIRAHMFKPEYELMYRALTRVPGVDFLSNSRNAAIQYGKWLDLPDSKFRIVYNGVSRPRNTPDTTALALWDEFAARTGDAKMTIGGVFRFATDKRPNLWIRFAHKHLKKHPDSRFVLVGAGDLKKDAKALADELGISERILFVGNSSDVGYWMKKMDVLVLLSRYEGLPNVLIEAQLMGVPVVTTPAGGATECFLDGLTGFSLDCAEAVDLEKASEYVHSLCYKIDSGKAFLDHGAQFLAENFSIAGMVEKFVNSLHAPAS